ncbi:hypothetical protein O1611_g2727 [Lasiodiplodia mahajangana]|uniref:Uncharacterized protein n=1 Tax=Lasiodiplodia mahajangana TaxID=1108764 RepID=A0ACC2JUG9_9PEZI|nr:hypothetical protein O1611_g2727 [Lasiodiplodia mahajangana]
MEAMALQQPQPDFNAVQTAPNLPAVDRRQQILDRLDRIIEEVQQVHIRLGTMETRSAARDSNAFARVLNNQQRKPEDQLQPFRALDTNEEIVLFPRTVREMTSLSAEAVTEILQLLGESTQGSLTQKRRRLKLFTGVVTLDV